MTNVLEVIIRAVDQASATIDKIGKSTTTATGYIEEHKRAFQAVGIAMAGAGVGMELFARQQAKLTEETRIMAEKVGLSEKAFRDMARAVTPATDSVSEFLEIMRVGSRQGITSAQDLAKYAEVWDTVADATGESATELASAGLALQAVGIEANQQEKALAAFGYAFEECGLSVGDFLAFISKAAPNMNTLGLSIDDAAVALGIYADRGVTGRKATAELNQAMEESIKTGKPLYETIGVTSTKWGEYTKEVKDSAGTLEKNAAIHESLVTPLEKIKNTLGEVAYKFGGLGSAVGALAPVLTVVGGSLAALPTLMPYIVSAMGAGTAAIIPMVVALGPLILAIGAAIAIGYALYKAWETNFLGIRDIVGGAKDYIVDRFEGIKAAMGPVKEALSGAADKIKEAFGKLFDKLNEVWEKFTGGISIVDTVGIVFNALGKVIDYVWKLIGEYLVKAIDGAVTAITILIDTLIAVIDWFVRLASKVKEIFITIYDTIVAFVGAIAERLGKIFEPFTGALDWLLQRIKDFCNNPVIQKIADVVGGKFKEIVNEINKVPLASDTAATSIKKIGDSGDPMAKGVQSGVDIANSALNSLDATAKAVSQSIATQYQIMVDGALQTLTVIQNIQSGASVGYTYNPTTGQYEQYTGPYGEEEGGGAGGGGNGGGGSPDTGGGGVTYLASSILPTGVTAPTGWDSAGFSPIGEQTARIWYVGSKAYAYDTTNKKWVDVTTLIGGGAGGGGGEWTTPGGGGDYSSGYQQYDPESSKPNGIYYDGSKFYGFYGSDSSTNMELTLAQARKWSSYPNVYVITGTSMSAAQSFFGYGGTIPGTVMQSGLPGLQHGGLITDSGSVWVGERQKELLTLPRGAQVTPLDKTATLDYDLLATKISQSLASALSGGVVRDVHLHGQFFGDENALRQLNRKLRSVNTLEDRRTGVA